MAKRRGVDAERAATLPKDVYELQLGLVRQVNDMHIFVQQALPLLQKAQKRYSGSDEEDDRAYSVPSHKKSGVAYRTDEELKEIYERFIAQDLYNNLLVAMVSRCESYLFDVLRAVLRAYPGKITLNVQGVEQKRTVDAEVVLNATDLDAVRCSMIEDRIHNLSYAKAADYLRFFHQVAQINTGDEAFSRFIEIKATRDVIVHNAGRANAIYLVKCGELARAQEGKALPMGAKYFDQCVATVKRVAGIVKRDIEANFTSGR